MSEHTKGPWSISHVEMFGRGGKGTKHYIFEGGDYVVKPSPGQAGPVVIAAGEANAARIVACVNTLEGYNPAAVRDVVEALRDFVDGVEYASGVTDTDDDPVATVAHQYDMIVGDQYRKAIAALAALEGGAA